MKYATFRMRVELPRWHRPRRQDALAFLKRHWWLVPYVALQITGLTWYLALHAHTVQIGHFVTFLLK